ncbi:MULTISPECIES: NADH-quinone oxidoreductase subunit NuoE [Spirosoma]|uniref:NAD(P)H-dependent oxidoreductase subunit E n=1 Tax=Spirosoma liriopis TaxID=2937440 RepID=A0ABT0HHG9_9BACT|nr:MULTISPECIES: NAD(P)H-dependent oxidoreductase subunit E [Spirosoma]MCK8491601.1 NAD(P)H-dependent oxidoreductase subunit E [Spirosoma liriopis]UHG90962.1 NAD(P)H-dependent oxidoreductase subunit E [Spirosoma oryzicola]
MSKTVENKTVVFTPERVAKAQEIIARYPADRQKSALLPLLHLLQEQEGWTSPEGMDYVARLLDIQPIEVYEVATFYTMYHIDPVGQHVIEYCRTGPCCLMGGEDVLAHLKHRLGIDTGQTTVDGRFTLKEVECLAACGMGPVFQIREKYYMNLTNERVDEIIDELSK